MRGAGSGPDQAGRPQPRRALRAWTTPDPLAPYRILVVIAFSAALFVLAFGALPSGSAQVRQVYTVLAVLLLGSIAIIWWVMPWLPNDLGLDISIGFGVVLAGVSTATVKMADAQFVVSLGLAAFAVFAAYFLPRPRLYIQLLAMSFVYGLGVAVNPQLSSLTVYVAIMAMICGIALMVATLVERLREETIRDALTGLLNRRGLALLAGPLLAAAERSGAAVTVGMIDLDDFKSFNDRHGHLAGDRLIIEVGDAWSSGIRSSDLIVRFGGDEYAVILTGTTVPEALTIADRVRDPHSGSWTAGFAEWTHGEPLDDALDRADMILLEAKRTRHDSMPGTVTPDVPPTEHVIPPAREPHGTHERPTNHEPSTTREPQGDHGGSAFRLTRA
jgi:diguanylate cyclase (GGDEF)-like protein